MTVAGGIATATDTAGWRSSGTGGTTIGAGFTVRGPMVTAGVPVPTVALTLGSGTGPTTGPGTCRLTCTVGFETGRRLGTGGGL